MELLRLFFRSRNALLLITLVPFYVLLLYFGPTGLGQVPFRELVQNVLIIVYGLLPAAILSSHLVSPMPVLEYMGGGSRLTILKTGWYVGLTGILLLIITLIKILRPAADNGTGLHDDLFFMLIRNTFLAVGIAWAGARLFPRAYSWALGAIVVLVVWQFGTDGYSGEHTVWSLPNYGSDSTASWFIAIGFWVLAGVDYLRARAAR